MTNETYEALLNLPAELPKAETKGKSSTLVKKVPWRQLKEKLIVMIVGGDTQGIEELLEEQPQITDTTFWRDTAAREAVEAGRVDSLKYLIGKGVAIKARNADDVVWQKALRGDDHGMFEYLFQQQAVNFMAEVKRRPYVLNLLENAPKITRFLVKQYGVGLDVLERNILNEAQIVQAIAGVIANAQEYPGEMSYQQTIAQLRALKIGSKGTRERLWNKVGEVIWTRLGNKDRPDLMQQLIAEDLVPKEPRQLLTIWYDAHRNNMPKVRRWLSQAPTIKQQIKESWPDDPARAKSSYDWHTIHEHSLESIQDLDALGLDLGAVNRFGSAWICTGSNLAKGTITWLAKRHPELFECKTKEGLTLLECLDGDKKSWAERAMLRGVLVSRAKPLRGKAAKQRI